jgi:hypothetical protein
MCQTREILSNIHAATRKHKTSAKNAALLFDSVSASSVEVVSEGRQMQQCLNSVI